MLYKTKTTSQDYSTEYFASLHNVLFAILVVLFPEGPLITIFMNKINKCILGWTVSWVRGVYRRCCLGDGLSFSNRRHLCVYPTSEFVPGGSTAEEQLERGCVRATPLDDAEKPSIHKKSRPWDVSS